MDGQGTKWRRNIAENFNRLSRAHERYRQTTDRQTDRRQTDGRRHIANMNLSSRSLKIEEEARVGRDLGTEVRSLVGSRDRTLIFDILGRRVTIIWSAKSDAINCD